MVLINASALPCKIRGSPILFELKLIFGDRDTMSRYSNSNVRLSATNNRTSLATIENISFSVHLLRNCGEICVEH